MVASSPAVNGSSGWIGVIDAPLAVALMATRHAAISLRAAVGRRLPARPKLHNAILSLHCRGADRRAGNRPPAAFIVGLARAVAEAF